MAPSSSAPLQDLGALVFGDDALDLQQQVVFGAGADRAVEEGDLDAGAPELFHQQRLVRVAPGEPVRRQHINLVNLAGGHGVAQLLQRWPHQGGTALALVDEGVIRIHHGSVGGDAIPQSGDLAGDRTVTRLGLAGDMA